MDGSIAIAREWAGRNAAAGEQARGASRHPSPSLPASLPEAALSRLYFAIEAARVGDAALIVQFVGVDGGEGVSTVAAGYVAQAARVPEGAILVVRCAPSTPAEADRRRPGLLEVFKAGRPLGDALAPLGGETSAPLGGDARTTGPGPAQASLGSGASGSAGGGMVAPAREPAPCAVCWAALGEAAEREADPRQLTALAAALRRGFRLVVLDCAPLAVSPLAGALSRIADGTVVVVAAGRTRRRGLERAVAEIGGMGGQVVGLVLNRHRDWLRRRTA